MAFQNYDTISEHVKNQIGQVREIWSRHLGGDLIGMYLHGSLALGYFQEDVSDIDILILSGRRLTRTQRLAIAGDILEADQNPCPLEMSAIRLHDLWPWKHPVRCQFHYSAYWTERYRALVKTGAEEIPD